MDTHNLNAPAQEPGVVEAQAPEPTPEPPADAGAVAGVKSELADGARVLGINIDRDDADDAQAAYEPRKPLDLSNVPDAQKVDLSDLVLSQIRIGRDRGDGVCVWRLGQ